MLIQVTFAEGQKKNQFRVDEVPGDLKSWRGKKKSLGDERLKCVGCRTKSKRGWIGFHHGHRHSVCYTNAKVLLSDCWTFCRRVHGNPGVFFMCWCLWLNERLVDGIATMSFNRSRNFIFFFLLFYSFFPSHLLIIVWSSMGIIRWLQWAFTILTLRCTQQPVFFRPHLLLFFSKLLLPIVLIPKRSFAISPLTLYTSL